ncbi:hypothetical protein NC652_000345 [Populus alba x Populus x berolinensis]|nr:hypothetical protein NC652_000345 [Populus alba x Populus x berolinensis]
MFSNEEGEEMIMVVVATYSSMEVVAMEMEEVVIYNSMGEEEIGMEVVVSCSSREVVVMEMGEVVIYNNIEEEVMEMEVVGIYNNTLEVEISMVSVMTCNDNVVLEDALVVVVVVTCNNKVEAVIYNNMTKVPHVLVVVEVTCIGMMEIFHALEDEACNSVEDEQHD